MMSSQRGLAAAQSPAHLRSGTASAPASSTRSDQYPGKWVLLRHHLIIMLPIKP
jgi:hypothetical protein